MATRAEIIDKLAARRLRKHYLPNLSRQQIRMAAQALTDSEWDDIISAIRDRQAFEAGEVLAKRVNLFLKNLSRQDVETALGQDDRVSVQDLIELF